MSNTRDLTLHQKSLLSQYKAQAQKLVSKKITAEQFALEQVEIHTKLEDMSAYDGLLNRFLNNEGFTKALTRELKVIKRLPSLTGTLLAIDIDRLKRFNDTHGHVPGDKLIKIYGTVIEQHTRAVDLKGRVGGDELAVFLVNSELENAKIVAERIRISVIEEVKKEFPSLSWDQTASIGVAQVQDEDTAQSLRERADQVLYQAKRKRNMVVVSGQEAPPPNLIQMIMKLKQRASLVS